MRMLSQVIVASLFTVKIIVGSLFVYQMSFGGVPLEASAIASERGHSPEGGETPARNQSPDPAPQQKAARLIEKLDIDLAIELLSNMKGDIVGDIFSFLDVQKAATISEELARKR